MLTYADVELLIMWSTTREDWKGEIEGEEKGGFRHRRGTVLS
jgi:hypothetical protein